MPETFRCWYLDARPIPNQALQLRSYIWHPRPLPLPLPPSRQRFPISSGAAPWRRGRRKKGLQLAQLLLRRCVRGVYLAAHHADAHRRLSRTHVNTPFTRWGWRRWKQGRRGLGGVGMTGRGGKVRLIRRLDVIERADDVKLAPLAIKLEEPKPLHMMSPQDGRQRLSRRSHRFQMVVPPPDLGTK